MRVFVTGGTGTIGRPVVAELLGHGHSVLALARSNGSADALEHAGAEVVRGGLADLDVLRAGAAQAEGVVSLAFTPEALAKLWCCRRHGPWVFRLTSGSGVTRSPIGASRSILGSTIREQDAALHS